MMKNEALTHNPKILIMARRFLYYKIITADNFLISALLLLFGLPSAFSQPKQRAAMEHHVAVGGNDRNDGRQEIKVWSVNSINYEL